MTNDCIQTRARLTGGLFRSLREEIVSEEYLTPTKGGAWSVSRYIKGRWIHLVDNSWLEFEEDASDVLHALGIDLRMGNLDLYFPIRGLHGRCPTLELLELFAKIEGEILKQHGV